MKRLIVVFKEPEPVCFSVVSKRPLKYIKTYFLYRHSYVLCSSVNPKPSGMECFY